MKLHSNNFFVEHKTKLDGKLNQEDFQKKEVFREVHTDQWFSDDVDGSNSVVVSNINVLDPGRGWQNQRMVSGSLSPETQSESLAPALLRTEDSWVGWLRWCWWLALYGSDGTLCPVLCQLPPHECASSCARVQHKVIAKLYVSLF